MKTKNLIAALVITLMPVMGFAAGGGGVELDHVRIDPHNKAALQRGAKTFVNYCLGCHSADYQRYNRMAKDLGLADDQVLNNMIFTTDEAGERTKVGSLMFNNMTKEYGKQAFGASPPNLSLTARSRGADWLYTYLRTFYVDPSRPVGVNNKVFAGASMPHVLWELQGLQKPVYEKQTDASGHESEKLVGFELISEGSQTPEEYDRTISDLVNFMAYMADPIKAERHRIGILVMLFLFVFLGVAYMLKKEYWKDIIK